MQIKLKIWRYWYKGVEHVVNDVSATVPAGSIVQLEATRDFIDQGTKEWYENGVLVQTDTWYYGDTTAYRIIELTNPGTYKYKVVYRP